MMEGQKNHFLVVMGLLVLCMGSSSAWVVFEYGCCPEPELQKNFDIARYMGRWFEYVRFPNTFQMGAKCVTANYTLNDDQSVRVLNGGIKEVSFGLGLCPWYESDVAEGNAIAVDKDNPAKLGVSFSEYSPRGKYWVVETDYDNYSVVFSCTDYKLFNTQNAWVLTRRRGVPPAELTKLYVRLSRKGINPSNFQVTDQKGCPDWPKK